MKPIRTRARSAMVVLPVCAVLPFLGCATPSGPDLEPAELVVGPSPEEVDAAPAVETPTLATAASVSLGPEGAGGPSMPPGDVAEPVPGVASVPPVTPEEEPQAPRAPDVDPLAARASSQESAGPPTAAAIMAKAVRADKAPMTLNAFRYVYVTDKVFDEENIRPEVERHFSRMGFTVLNKASVEKLDENGLLTLLLCDYNYSAGRFHLNLQNAAGATVYRSKGEAWQTRVAMQEACEKMAGDYSGFDIEALRRAATQGREMVRTTRDEVTRYLDGQAAALGALEGIWSTGDNEYTVGIVRDERSPHRDFVGVVLEARRIDWVPGEVKAEFEATADSNVFTAVWYMGDKSSRGTTAFLTPEGVLRMSLGRRADGSGEVTISLEKKYPGNLRDGLGPEDLAGSAEDLPGDPAASP